MLSSGIGYMGPPFLSMRSSFLRSISVGKSNSSGNSDRLYCQAHAIRGLVMSPISAAGRLPKLQSGQRGVPGGDTHDKVMCYDILPTQPLAAIEM